MINLIYATTKNGVVGKDNSLPWPKMEADMRRFYNITRNSAVVMGRKTYQSIGKKRLKERRNVVLSTVLDERVKGFTVIRDFDEIKRLDDESIEDVYVIGGEGIWQRCINNDIVGTVYRTVIDMEVADGDTFEPDLGDKFELFLESNHKKDADNPYDYTFQTWLPASDD